MAVTVYIMTPTRRGILLAKRAKRNFERLTMQAMKNNLSPIEPDEIICHKCRTIIPANSKVATRPLGRTGKTGGYCNRKVYHYECARAVNLV